MIETDRSSLQAPQVRPSIWTLRTASSSFFMSVSSSHGFTSIRTEDLPPVYICISTQTMHNWQNLDVAVARLPTDLSKQLGYHSKLKIMHTFFLLGRGLGSRTLISSLLILLGFITEKIQVVIIIILQYIKHNILLKQINLVASYTNWGDSSYTMKSGDSCLSLILG